MNKKINLFLSILIISLNNVHPSNNNNEILTNLSKQLINQTTKTNNIDTKTNQNESNISTLDDTTNTQGNEINDLNNQTKLNYETNNEIEKINDFLRKSFGYWKFRSIPSEIDGYSIREIDTKITISSLAGEPTLVGVCGNGNIITSFDGITWDLINTPTSSLFGDSGINDVASGDNGGFKWIAVGFDGEAARSTNGTDWTLISDATFTSTFGTDHIYGIDFGFTLNLGLTPTTPLVVVVGANGKIASSQSNTVWVPATWSGTPPAQKFFRVKYGFNYDTEKGLWIAVGNGKVLARSEDGKDWETFNLNSLITSNVIVQSVEYEDGLWIICTSAGKILTSIDGINWLIKLDLEDDTYDYDTNIDFHAIAYGEGRWVISGQNAQSNSLIATSLDAETWTIQPSSSDRISNEYNFRAGKIWTIRYHDGIWVAAGDNAKLASGYVFWD